MLEKLPHFVGRGLVRLRPGLERVVAARPYVGIVTAAAIELESVAFVDGAQIPKRFTADGEGTSPPLQWTGVPNDTRSLALIVEDADSPSWKPLVHAIATNIPPDCDGLDTGALKQHEGAFPTLGKNSFLKAGWMPPDPPPGHGPHRYVFQLFALDWVPELAERPGRSALIEAVRGHVLGRGLLVGTYVRE